MDIFSRLSDTEKNELLQAIPAITILIAGADDEIDQEETDWAKKLTNIRSFANNEELHDYYHEVGLSFDSNLDKLLATSANTPAERTVQFSDKLSSLNPILAKLDDKIAYLLYKDFVSFAKHVATASGGFLRFGAISSAEKKLIPLTMLDEVHYEEEEA